MFYKIVKNEQGQSLLELLVAMTIFILVISSIIFLTVDAHSANRQGSERSKAALIAQEGYEAAKSIANRGWRNLTDGDHGINDSGGYWEWQGNSNVVDKYTRRITVAPVYRTVNSNIAQIGGEIDFDTKKITSQTIWNFTTARPSEVTVESYLMNWRSIKWKQTTQAEFDQGILNGVVTTATDDGEFQMEQTVLPVYNDWTFDTPTEYTYNSSDIEVVSSQARLINQGSIIGSGGTINSSFDSSLSPWTFSTWDQDVGEITPAGLQVGSGGNPGARARLRFGKSQDDQVGGYFEQSFQVIEDNSTTGMVNFDWQVSDYSGDPPLVLEIFVYLDTAAGEPVPGTHIWSSGSLTSTTGWASEAIDVAFNISQPGTYYIKFAAWLVSGGQRTDSIDISFDNVTATWEKRDISYPTTNPTIQPVNSFSSTDILAWRSFLETSVKNGGEIYYQLSDDNGSTWQYWNGSTWTIAGAADYNAATVINANISFFPVTAQQLTFKAFLSSDGGQLVRLDNVRVVYDSVRQNDWTFDTPAEYTYNSLDIEVVSSQARLINQGSIIGSGGTINSSFDSGLPPWTFSTWDQDVGEITPVGSQQSRDGNPGARAQLRFPRRSEDDQVGGYFEQSFQVTEDNSTSAIVNFDWRVSGYPGTPPASLEVFVYLDTAVGEPVPGTHIWSSGSLTGTTDWASEAIDIITNIATQGTYYLKAAAWMESTTPRTNGNIDISFDNVTATWEKRDISYPTTNPTIQPVNSFSSTDILAWRSFLETSVKNGGEIYYQLSDDNGSTWQYWNGSTWTIAGASNYNAVTVINANISFFPVTAQQLTFKAFLSSDGSQLVRLDNVRVEYFASGGIGYFLTGMYESSAFDTGINSPFYNYLNWMADQPVGTRVEWQLRTADTEGNLGTAVWVGPDGTGGTFYTYQGELIELDPGATGARWVQYMVYFYSDSISTPIIKDVIIDYES